MPVLPTSDSLQPSETGSMITPILQRWRGGTNWSITCPKSHMWRESLGGGPTGRPRQVNATGQAFSHHCQLLWAEQSAWERINRGRWKETVRPNHEVSICQIQLGLLYLIHSTNIYWISMMCWLGGSMVIHQKDKIPLPMEFTVLSTSLKRKQNRLVQQNKIGRKVKVIWGGSFLFKLTRIVGGNTISHLLKTWSRSHCGWVRALLDVATKIMSFNCLIKEKFMFDRCSSLASGFPWCSESGRQAPSTSNSQVPSNT